MAYDKNAYNNQYKKDHFDHITFYAPKGTKDLIQQKAQTMGVKPAEYLRRLVLKDIQ
jgi:hypothetical protein